MSRTEHRSGSVSVIVPTYQEAENIADLVGRIEAVRDEHNLELDLLILDDPSDDGTARIVADLAKPWVRLISRSGKRGLSYAVADGLAAATGDRLLVMDADLSHPPEAIPSMLAALDESTVDFVIGSRYVPGASTDEAWKFLRWVNSKIAARLARPFTRAKDPKAGFFALRRQTEESAETLNPIGYKIGLELLVKCGCRKVAEVPIHFAARAKGQSKLTLTEQLRYLRHLKRLVDYKYGTLSPGRGRAVKLLIALAVLNAALVPVFAFKGTTELDVYLTAASHLVRGEEIYRVAGDIGPAFTYPPLSALIVTPLVLLPVLGERIAWCVVQITLATVLLSALWRGLSPRLQPDSGARHGAAAIFWTVMLLVGLRYLLFPLDNQSHDLVVAALIAGGALLGARGRDGLGGLLLGLAAALKATPLLFLPVLALQQRWRAVGAMLAAILVASAVPDLIAPRNDGQSNIVRWIEIA
ncbi:MAG: glycosyltransferase, partial [Gemmatimonadales bacterium]